MFFMSDPQLVECEPADLRRPSMCHENTRLGSLIRAACCGANHRSKQDAGNCDAAFNRPGAPCQPSSRTARLAVSRLRSNMKLDTLLDRTGARSLTVLVKKR
jgi:hypothetical protein